MHNFLSLRPHLQNQTLYQNPESNLNEIFSTTSLLPEVGEKNLRKKHQEREMSDRH